MFFFFFNQLACPTFPQRAYFGLYMPQIICTAKMAQKPLVAGSGLLEPWETTKLTSFNPD